MKMKCDVCGKENPAFAWTDTHGVAQCCQCGTPYLLYHYEGEGDERRRVTKEPEIAVSAEWVPLLREYWDKTYRIIPGGYSFQGGQELATKADMEAFNDWMYANEHRVTDIYEAANTEGRSC